MSTLTYIPLLANGEAVPGYWRVTAASEQAARMMIEERMQRRAWFTLCREWIKAGKKVREVQDDKITS